MRRRVELWLALMTVVLITFLAGCATGAPKVKERFFWPPLPEHVLGKKSATQLLSDPTATRSPLGWGPYAIREWAAGGQLTMPVQGRSSHWRQQRTRPGDRTALCRGGRVRLHHRAAAKRTG